MRSAISRVSCQGAGDLLRSQRLLQHLEHDLQRFEPNDSAAERAEMLRTVTGRLPATGKGEVDQSFFAARGGRSGKAGGGDRNFGRRASKATLGHRPSDDFRDRIVLV